MYFNKLNIVVFVNLSILVIVCRTSNSKRPPEKTDCFNGSNELNCNENRYYGNDALKSHECSWSQYYVEGYPDGSDEKNCTGPEPLLFVTTGRDIRYISLPSKKSGVIHSGNFLSHGVEFSYKENFVYWSARKRDKAGIYKSMLNGTAFQHVISAGVEAVEDLAIDWIADHIYFTDSGRKHIAVCKLDGSICTVVISGQLHKPRAVAVHLEERLLFWSDWGSYPHIGSAGMDGSERAKLITTDIIWPNGLTVDESIQRIFWIDAKLNRIESCHISGSDRNVLLVEVSHPYALDILKNTIYWCDPKENKVISADKFTGRNREVLMSETSPHNLTGIHVYHPSKQRPVSNPCKKVSCSHFCLLSPNADNFSCACPTEMTLNQNKLTCDPSSKRRLSIVTATSANISLWTFRQIGKNSTVSLPIEGLEKIGALAFNPLTYSIIYSDLNSKFIYIMYLNTYQQHVLFENADSVEGLDVDPYTGTIYWTEIHRGTVVMGYKTHKPDTSHTFERFVLIRGLDKPKAIILASKYGLMFIVEESFNYVISIWDMDGWGRRNFVPVRGAVSAMAYDGKHLYFSDSRLGSSTIERIEVDGRNRRTLRSYLGTVMSIDTSSKSVFWLTQQSTRISWLNKENAERVRGFVKDVSDDITHQYRLMAVVEPNVYDTHHVCYDYLKRFDCSGICVPTPRGPKCLCPEGFC